ncbi:mechanosensitive ion channel family protein [Luteimonas sp. R10]|uniref:mechanosensitive ion channel family protein n=1 Tax=Luteimonas sp. R10 TaxID=3108176 RepID=UPI00308538DE|nr:mechanosensitive ion channel domain-containing protein [Luteimonas sp. R10]
MKAAPPAPAAAPADGNGGMVERGWAGLQPLLEQPLVAISGLRLTLGGLLFALLALLAAWLLSALLRRAIGRWGERHEGVNAAALYTVSRLVHYVLLVVGFLVALDLAGIPVTKFAIFAGAIGVGLGFGLQAIFSNFISGLILLFDRSLKVGDFVQLDDNLRGTVRAINIRATLITTNDNIDVIVPNSEFVSGRVVNWTHGSIHRRIRVRFGVAYGADKELVKKAALEAAAAVPFTLSTEGERRPQVWLVNFGDNAVEFILAVWLNEAAARRNAAIEAAYLWELDTALKRHGVEIPFPQRDLHLRSLLGLHGEAALAALRGEAPATAAAQDGAGAADLPRHERAVLASNDAQQDVEREIAEQAAPDAPAAPPTTKS